jgi:hypothetical protein
VDHPYTSRPSSVTTQMCNHFKMQTAYQKHRHKQQPKISKTQSWSRPSHLMPSKNMYLSKFPCKLSFHFILGLSTVCFPQDVHLHQEAICTPCLRDFSQTTRQLNLPHFTDLTATYAVTTVNVFPPILTVNPQHVSSITRTVAGFKACRHDEWVISNSLT